MVSFEHELLVELFRACSELAPALLRTCKGVTIEHATAELRSSDLSQVTSTEYRADAVVVLRDPDDAVVAAVIVEVQLAIDHDKERTWPLYVAALHRELGRPIFLVVVTPSRAVARWASRRIEIGHPGFSLAPLVVELRDVPRIVDPAEVRRLPELGVLSAIANPEPEVARVAVAAISQLPEDRARLYLDVIMAALPPSVREALEAQMLQGYVYKSEFARKYYFQGLDEGMAKGLEEGREQGRERGLEEGREQGRERGLEEGREQGRERGLEEGRARGLRSAVLTLMRARLTAVTADDEAALEAVCSEAALTGLIASIAGAPGEAEVRAALAAAPRG